MIEKITTLNDVALFTRQIIAEGINLHPDDDFRDMLDAATNLPFYSPEEAEKRNRLMEQCFEVCEKNNVSIYDFMLEIFLKETGLDKYVPLPSEEPCADNN